MWRLKEYFSFAFNILLSFGGAIEKLIVFTGR